MAAITFAGISAMLKVRYSPERARLMAYRRNVLLGLLPKREDFTGLNYTFAIWYAPGGGRSAAFASAQGNQAAESNQAFVLTRTTNYGVHSIGAEALRASVGKEAAFVAGRGQMMDSVVYKLARDLNNDLYRDGTGVRGRVGALPGGNVVTLTNRNDVVHFEKGMVLVAVDGAGAATAATRAAGTNSMTITAVNRNTGQLTFGGGLITGLSAAGSGDWLIAIGDAANAGAKVKLSGMDSWLDPSAAALFGVTRTDDTQRLAGIHYDGSLQTVEEALIDAGSLAVEADASPEFVIMNPLRRADLAKSLQQKAVYDVKSSDGRVFYSSITVETGAGPVKVLSDPCCPANVAYMLQPDTWEFVSLDSVPHIADEDGLTILRSGTADEYEVRFRYWAQLGCHAPGMNVRITLPTS